MQNHNHRALPKVEAKAPGQQAPDEQSEQHRVEPVANSFTEAPNRLTESPVASSPTGTSPIDRASGGTNDRRAPKDTPALGNSPDTAQLKAQLNDAFRKSRYSGERVFLPIDKVKEIITEDSVVNYCQRYGLAGQAQKVKDYVFGPQSKRQGSARKIFSILVLLGKPDLILGVVEEKIYDDDLPLAQCKQQGMEFQLARRHNMLMDPIKCFSKWDWSDKSAFDTIQFQVETPVFQALEVDGFPRSNASRSRHNRRSSHQADDYVAQNLDTRQVLPLTSYDEKRQIFSGSSKVVRVKIHQAHHHFNQKVCRVPLVPCHSIIAGALRSSLIWDCNYTC